MKGKSGNPSGADGIICEVEETQYGFKVSFTGPVKHYGFKDIRSTKKAGGDIFVNEEGMIVAVDLPTMTRLPFPTTGRMIAIKEINNSLQDSSVVIAARDRYDGGDKLLVTLKDLSTFGCSFIPGDEKAGIRKLAVRLLGKTIQEIEKGGWFKLKLIGS